MKAFLAGTALALLLALGAAFLLNSFDISSEHAYSTDNVRLGG